MAKTSLMTQLYNTCSIIYRLLLGLIIPFSFFAKVLVGAAGHNSQYSNSDYFTFVFIAITICLLTALHHTEREKTSIRSILRFVVIILVLASLVFAMYLMYGSVVGTNFSMGGIILSAIIALFVFLSFTVFWGLIKDKV